MPSWGRGGRRPPRGRSASGWVPAVASCAPAACGSGGAAPGRPWEKGGERGLGSGVGTPILGKGEMMAPGTLCTRNQQRWGLGPVGVGHPGHWEPLAVGTPGVGHWEPLALGPMGTGTHGHQALRPTDWHWETQVPTGAGTHKHGALGTVMVGTKTHWCWVPLWASGTRTYWCWDPWALGTGSRWCRTPQALGTPGTGTHSHWAPRALGTGDPCALGPVGAGHHQDPPALNTPGTGTIAFGHQRTRTHWHRALGATGAVHGDPRVMGTGTYWCRGH